MKGRLSRRQREILAYIGEHTREKGYPPSVREIGNRFGLVISTVHSHLLALQRKGYIYRDPTKPRAIEVLRDEADLPPKRTVPVPIVGRVEAGPPSLAVEEVEDVLPLPEDFVRGERVFLFRVRGESMVGAGIHDGDFLLVRRQEVAEDGDIVLALLGEEATVKRFCRMGEAVLLRPENPTVEPIVARDVRIVGRVVGLIRRLE